MGKEKNSAYVVDTLVLFYYSQYFLVYFKAPVVFKTLSGKRKQVEDGTETEARCMPEVGNGDIN